jgi:hypothetical protein
VFVIRIYAHNAMVQIALPAKKVMGIEIVGIGIMKWRNGLTFFIAKLVILINVFNAHIAAITALNVK